MIVQQNTSKKLFVYLPKEIVEHLELKKGLDIYYKKDITDKGKKIVTLSKALVLWE